MATRNMELTHEWALVAAGPVIMISFEPGRSARNSLPQVCISPAVPSQELEGHEINSLTSAELSVGEGLYARAIGIRSRLIITTENTTVSVMASMVEPVVQPVAEKRAATNKTKKQ